MKIFGIRIITDAKFRALKAEAGAFIDTEADKVVAALKQTAIGDAVADSICALKNKDMSGGEKFAAVLAETAPVILGYIKDDGIDAVIDDVEDLARQLVQSVYNDVMSTGFGKIVADIKRLLGL